MLKSAGFALSISGLRIIIILNTALRIFMFPKKHGFGGMANSSIQNSITTMKSNPATDVLHNVNLKFLWAYDEKVVMLHEWIS
jgi:hypothetical protein